MAMTENDKRAIFGFMAEFVGDETANNFMDHLPTEPATQLATRDHLDAYMVTAAAERVLIRNDLETYMAEAATDRQLIRDELRTQMDAAAADRHLLRGEMALGFANLSGEINQRFLQSQRWLIGAVIGLSGVIVAAATAVASIS